MPQLVILCTLQRLQAWNTERDAMCCLLLSAATDDGHPVHEDGLKPWKWLGGIKEIQYSILGEDGRPVDDTTDTAKVIGRPADSQVNSLKKDFFAGIDQQYELSKKNTSNLMWEMKKFEPNSKDGTYTSQVSGEKLRPWPSLLGRVSTYPFPLAQSANLSFLFRVPRETLKKGKKIVAVPVINKAAGVKGAFPSQDLKPKGAPHPAEDKRVHQWDYDGLPDWPVLACVAAIPIEDTQPNQFLNRKTQWITTSSGNVFHEEWLPYLEDRIADAFDLSQQVIDFIRQKKDTLQGSDLISLSEMAISSLRDIAGYGLTPAPGNVLLFQRLLDMSSPRQASLSAADLAKLTAAADDLERNLSLIGWKKQVRNTIQETANLAVMDEKPSPLLSVARVLAELQALHELVLETETKGNLRLLAQNQWADLFKKAGISGSDNLLRLMAAATENLNLRHALALSNLGRFWDSLIRSNVKPDDKEGLWLVNECFPWYLSRYCALRFGFPPPAPVAGVADMSVARSPAFAPNFQPTLTGSLASDLLAKVTGYAKSFAKSLVAPAVEEGCSHPSSDEPARVAHPIVLQLGKVGPLAEEAEDSFGQDPMEGFSGVGVFMREKGSSDWLCLNWTKARTKGKELSLAGPLLVPHRVDFKSGLRQACVSYNNQPLLANSPLGDERMTLRSFQGQGAGFQNLLEQVYDPAKKIPGLKYGSTYQFRPFAISVSGALPREIAQENSPCEIDEQKLQKLEPLAASEVSYLRRTAVGPLRMGYAQDQQLPPIPENVHPRARDIAKFSKDSICGPSQSYRELPLLLLANREGMKAFVFEFRRPATTWDCWARWVAARAGTGELRAKIIADYFRKAALNDCGDDPNKKCPKHYLMVDDPAVENDSGEVVFHLQLQHVNDLGALENAGSPQFLKFPALDKNAEGLDAYRAKACNVSCMWADDMESAGIAPDGTVTVVAGEVYKLTASVCIPVSNLGRFDPLIYKPSQNGKYLFVSPVEILIEAADSRLPKSKEVWDLFKAGFRRDSNGAAVVVTLGGGSRLFRNLYRAELRRQVWRWQGRATREHPLNGLEMNFGAQCAEAASLEKKVDCEVRMWEAVEFGDRPESDHVIMNMSLNTPSDNGAISFHYEEKLETAAGRSSLGGNALDLRSMHYRFGVTAFSRYEGLFDDSPGGQSQSQAHASTTIDPETGEESLTGIERHWRYVFVPCRHLDKIPVPKVRLIFPLAEMPGAASRNANGGNAPGLLLVLNEPWHETGGLAEYLDADIDVSPDVTADGKYFSEIGPDPILAEKDDYKLNSHKKETPSARIPRQQIQGPVGHYFDARNTAAYFPATSFVIPAPRFATPAPGNPGWYFAKLKFRRVVRTCSNEIKLGDPAPYRLDERFSEWTDPLWVQYLPPFSVFDDQKIATEKLDLVVSSDLKRVSLVDFSGRAQDLKPFPSKSSVFTLFLVLTRKVFDVTGRQNQEQYIGLYQKSQDAGWEPVEALGGTDHTFGCRARIIEVQGTGTVDGAQLWEKLLDGTVNDAKVRIVRISNPVDQSLISISDCED